MDLRLWPLAFGTWLGAAGVLVIGTHVSSIWILVWLCAMTLLSGAVISRIKAKASKANQLEMKRITLFCLIGVTIGTLAALTKLQPILTGPVYGAAKEQAVVRLQGSTVSDLIVTQKQTGLDWSTKEIGRVNVRVNQIITRGKTSKVRVPITLFTSNSADIATLNLLPPGTLINFSASLSPAMPGQPVAATANLLEGLTVKQGAPRFQVLALSLRNKLHLALRDTDPDGQALVPGLALGDTSKMNSELNEAMRDAGLTHLIAVSGTNVTLLLALILSLMRRVTAKRKVWFVVALLALLAFVILVRPQPSVLRASVMGIVALVAGYWHFEKSALPALGFAIVGLVLLDPWLAISYGFALSVAATAGLLLGSKRMMVWLDKHLPRKIPEWVLETFAITVCAQVAVFPLLVALDSRLSLASIPANMIAVPLAGPAMIFGVLAALLSVLWLPAGHLVALCASLLAQVIASLARISASMTWLVIPWPKGVFGVLLSIVSLGMFIHIWFSWKRLHLAEKSMLASSIICFGTLIWLPPGLPAKPWPPVNWLMVQCDVGQGDGTVVRTDVHEGIVIDVGVDDIGMDRCLNDLGITTIPILVLTHFHADHVMGLESVLEGRSVGQVWLSPLPDPPVTTAIVRSVLKKLNIPEHVMTFPNELRVKAVSLRCIWPSRIILGQGSDPNNASVVLLVSVRDKNFLLTGDIEPAVQEAVRQENPDLHVDVIKIAHHGSRNQSLAFAQWVHAKIATISVGKGNDYGHPAKQTIEMYQNSGSQVFRTDEHSDLAVVLQGDQLMVIGRR